MENRAIKFISHHSRRIRDIPLSHYQVWLKVNRRQLKCTSCQKVFSEDLDFVNKRRSYTTRLAAKVLREVLETNVESAARRNSLTPAEVETLLKEAEAEACPEKPQNLKKLGIDEITQLKGGKNYAAVLVDLETRKPITLLKKRNKETVAEYLRSLGSALLEQIEEVSIDLWRPYKSVIEEILPKAQIVADRFHVMKQINEELDRFLEWTEKAYKYFPKSCRTISRWIDEILAYFDNRTTQGIVEGINQKIKLIKKRAYGLSNFDNFRRRVLLNWHLTY